MSRGPLIINSLLLCTALAIGIIAYTQVMLRVGSGTPPQMLAGMALADRVVVDKSDRTLTLMQGARVMQSYPIALGGNPVGHKQFEGDEKTPEGSYTLDWRNANSIAHLSLHISYPDATDTAFAASQGRSAGGNIMIHGTLNGWGGLGAIFQRFDWTNGCIAVTNEDMKDIWRRVPNGTKIEITP